MRVVMHIDVDDWSRLLGVWVAPPGRDGFPECYYPDPSEGYQKGLHRMRAKGTNLSWEGLFAQLEYSIPYFIYWSLLDVPDEPLVEGHAGRPVET